MYNGGKPFIVMPIVFGSAVTISAITSYLKESGHVKVNPMLWVGIAGIVICAVIVAYNTPHAAPPKKPGDTAAAGHAATPSPKPHS